MLLLSGVGCRRPWSKCAAFISRLTYNMILMKKHILLWLCLLGCWRGAAVYGQQYWELNGNMITTGTNFLGTINPISLDFRVNNTWAGTIAPDGKTMLGLEAGHPLANSTTTAIGNGVLKIVSPLAIENTGVGYKALNHNSSGYYNTAIGSQSLMANDTGVANTAVGALSLSSNTFGGGNTAIGVSCLKENTIGNRNTGNGCASLVKNTGGNDNSAVGFGSLFENTTGSDNAALGAFSLVFNLTGSWNTSVGSKSMQSNTTGANNAACGYESLSANTIGNDNTAFGSTSMRSNTTGAGNTAAGYRSLMTNTFGYDNVALGRSALELNQSGYRNTATGAYSLFSNQNGVGNTGIGYGALRLNTGGSENTAIGGFALGKNQVGKRNVAVGANALANSTAGFNAAVGFEALWANTTGFSNTAMGVQALHKNTTRSNLVAIGDSALMNNGVGATQAVHASGNTAVGSKAMLANTRGYYNTSVGTHAMRFNTTGYENAAFGMWSLINNTSGYYNSAMGMASLANNSSGWANAALGWHAAIANTTGRGNTAVGYRTLEANTTGYDNTAVGNQAFANGTTYTNSSAIGYRAQPQGSNEVVLGNASIVSLRCNTTTITTGSDQRFKEQVKEDVPGLEFIEKLRPVTYQISVDKLNELLGVQDSSDSPGKYDIEKRRITGLIAQEVEAAAKTCQYEFSGVDKPQQEGGLYGLRYSEFVVPLVKATQELSAQNEAQNALIADQAAMIQALQARLDLLAQQVEGCCNRSTTTEETGSLDSSSPADGAALPAAETQASGNRLDPNVPNPFSGQTVIRYAVANVEPDTYIRITSMDGIVVGHYPITVAGEGQIIVESDRLANGVYPYGLIVNGKPFASHKMVIAK